MWPILNRTIITPSRCVFPLKWHVSVILTVDLNGSDRPGYVPNRRVSTTNLSQTINKSITDNTTYHCPR